MFAHSPSDEYPVGEKGRKVPVRTTGRRVLLALIFGSLGCSVGFALSASWRTGPHTQECVAHFDLPRPMFLEEARVVTVTARPAATAVVSPPPALDQSPLLLNGPPTSAFKGWFMAGSFEGSAERSSQITCGQRCSTSRPGQDRAGVSGPTMDTLQDADCCSRSK